MSIERRKGIIQRAAVVGIPIGIAVALLASQDNQADSPWPGQGKFPGSPTPSPGVLVQADLPAYGVSPVVTAGLARVSPTSSTTPSPDSVDTRITPAIGQRGVGAPTFNDKRFEEERISPHQPEAFMRHQIAACNDPEKAVRAGMLAGILDNVLTRLSRRAEASLLDRSDNLSRELQPKTAEELIKCLQGIEKTRPFLSDKGQARKFGFQPVDVEEWELGKNVAVLGMDTTVNWQIKLTGELQKRGFRMSQAAMNTLLRSPVTAFLNPKTGKLDTFTVQTLDDADQVVKKRLAGELSFHSSSEDRWILIDLKTSQVIASFTRCDNVSVPAPAEQISTPATTPKLPDVPPTATEKPAVPSATPTPQLEQPTQPPATATFQPPATFTPTPAPTNTETLPTLTPGATATLVSTRTPVAPTPTAIGKPVTPTPGTLATPTPVGPS